MLLALRTGFPSLRSFAFGDYAFNNAPSIIVTRIHDLLK